MVVAEKSISARTGRPTEVSLEFKIKSPRNEAHLVCVALGDSASHPSWRTASEFTLAATNPVFLDVDSDRQYSSPRATARTLLARAGDGLEQRWAAVNNAEEAVAVQMAGLMLREAPGDMRAELEKRVRNAGNERPLFQEYFAPAVPVIKIEASRLK